MAAMEMTEDTPITMPMTVRNERTFAERSVSMAARKFSRACDVVIMAIGFILEPKPKSKPENAEEAKEAEVFGPAINPQKPLLPSLPLRFQVLLFILILFYIFSLNLSLCFSS